MREITQAAFARELGVSPAMVTKYISTGKIDGAALIKRGDKTLVDADLARKQLNERLDPMQVRAQRKATLPLTPEQDISPSDTVRFNKARADKAVFDAEDARRRLAAQAGTYVIADDVKRIWGKELTDLVAAIEEWLPQLGDKLAAEFQIDTRSATVAIKKGWRAFRQSQAEAAQARSAALATFVADPSVKDDAA